jgi:hypothetical protein
MLLAVGAVGVLPVLANAASDADCKSNPPKDQDCGTHNMMVVGHEAIYLSHLPMFHSEHRFQLILEVNLKNKNGNVDKTYFDDRARHSQTRMYTVEPADRFVLSRVFSGGDASKRKSFKAGVYRGHLERGGEKIAGLNDIDVQIGRVIYSAELPSNANPDKNLDYILFGKGDDFYLAHQIKRAPDFDQIIAVKVDGNGLSEEDLKNGILVTIPNRPNAPAKRVGPQEVIEATGQIIGTGRAVPLRLTADTELYFEESELRAPPDFAQTAIEKAAGF